jgi:hypothetical protein
VAWELKNGKVFYITGRYTGSHRKVITVTDEIVYIKFEYPDYIVADNGECHYTGKWRPDPSTGVALTLDELRLIGFVKASEEGE